MLHEFIAVQRDQIIRRRRERVAIRSTSPRVETGINHGVPVFLDRLVSALARVANLINTALLVFEVPRVAAMAPSVRGVVMRRDHALIRLRAPLSVWLAASQVAARVSAGWCSPMRWRCGLVGHDDQLAREPRRLFLRCGACGRCTRGWTIGANPPRVTAGRLRSSSPPVARAEARRDALLCSSAQPA